MPKLCEFENCRRQATYGEFYGNPMRCNLHKEDYKLVCRLCQEGNCKLIPTYNYQKEIKAIYCSNHKLDGMVDIKHKRCEHEGCDTRPTYNYEGQTKAIYCVSHKLDGMVDINNKKCEYNECYKLPAYNYKGETKRRYCVEHKLDNMIDVAHKKCEYEECDKRPHYNYENQTKAIYCVSHKLDGMVDIKTKKCENETCNKQSTYNYKGKKNAIYCVSHKLDGMIDIKNKICKSNFCLGTRANIKYKGYCSSCFQHLFPNDPLSFQIRSKTKEIAVRDYINSIFTDFQHDLPLWTGNCDCTHRRRIDHRKLIGNTLLCIETDEYQHKSYDKADEEIRYDDLFMLHGGKFIYIRFNPDKFKKNGKSCNPMMYTRLPILREEIERQMNRIENEENTELLEIIKLFYDE
jgi:hypothetical protein